MQYIANAISCINLTREDKVSNTNVPNPRQEIEAAIAAGDLLRLLKLMGMLHGHFCPGSALGVMASVYGLSQLGREGVPSDGMEELMAIVETNACFADGVQLISGCTLGNNALIYRDLGRHAVTFARRGQETGVRVRVLPAFRSYIKREVPEFFSIVEKVIENKNWRAEWQTTYRVKGWEAARALIKLPFEEMLAAQIVSSWLPEYAPIAKSATCPICGEEIMATKTVVEGVNHGLCRMCSGEKYFQVEGQGIVAKN
jgi:formylmethanofuran dehydrogenase subunit E